MPFKSPLMGSACFVTNKRAWSIVLKYVCLFWWFFYGQIKIPREGHSVEDSKTTFGSALASFVTEIFHEFCPFCNTPLPLINNNKEYSSTGIFVIKSNAFCLILSVEKMNRLDWTLPGITVVQIVAMRDNSFLRVKSKNFRW